MGKPVTDYYTEMCSLWEELENLTDLPPITNWNEEIGAYINALHKYQDERKLFQFLNGLDDIYSTQKSNLLMKSPLPPTEEACCVIQQEESQREILRPAKEEYDAAAMMSKTSPPTCTHCGKTGHLRAKCWYLNGFPPSFEKGESSEGKGRGKETTQSFRGGRWQRGQRGVRSGRGSGRFAGNAQSSKEKENTAGSSNSGTTGGMSGSINPQLLEQLIKMLPLPSKTGELRILMMKY